MIEKTLAKKVEQAGSIPIRLIHDLEPMTAKEKEGAFTCCLCNSKAPTYKCIIACNELDDALAITQTFPNKPIPRKDMLVKLLFCNKHKKTGQWIVLLTRELGSYASDTLRVAQEAAATQL